MKEKLISVLLVLCTFFCCITLPAGAAELPTEENKNSSVMNGCSTADAQLPLMGQSQLLETAGAAVLFEINSGTLMYAWNPDLLLPPASLVKIMTGLLVVEHGDLSATVSVSSEALASLPQNASTTDLQAGEQISVTDLLYCLLVGSSNDAAVVLAEHVAGSQERFVEQMNLKGAQLGFRGTVFTNPHGLHDPAQMTTARDMAKLLAYATTIDGFAPFFAATSYTVPKTNLSEERELSSTNYMMIPEKKLYYDSRVTGGRTGITDDRKRTLAVTAKTDDLHYAAVILSAVPVFEDDGYTVKYFGTYEEMGELLDMGFDGYRRTQVLMPGQVLMQCDVANGANAVAAMSEDTVTIVLPSGITMDQLQVHYSENISNLNAPIEAGKKLSEVQIWYNNICVAVSSVIAGNSSSYDSNVVMEHDASSGNVLTVILTVLGILVLIAAIIAAVLFGMRYVRIAGARMQRRRRSAARRRSR